MPFLSVFCRLALLALVSAQAAFAGESLPRITVIIDDLGYSLAAGRRTIALPGPVVCAVLPQTPRARDLAELAVRNHKEVLLHLPLQSAVAPGGEPGSITLDMTRERFAATLAANIDSVPFAIGINNHKGSLLTRQAGHMRWLMEEIAARNLLFVDSYTTHLSVALSAAQEAGIPAARRDVFIDADRHPQRIAAEFERLKALARLEGSAVGIGHPYANTLSFLEQELPTLAAQGFELVGIRELLRQRHAQAQAARRNPLTTSSLR